MEILFVSHKYPPATGGMEKQSFELITGMTKHAKVHKIVHTGEENVFQFFRKLNNRILQTIHTHPGIEIIHFNDGLIASLSLLHSGYTHLKRVVTVHGLDVVFPSWIYQRIIVPKFRSFDQIIAVSSATAFELEKRKIRHSKITIINNGVDHRLDSPQTDQQWNLIREKYSIPNDKKILLMLGRAVKRKGFSWFISEVLPTLPSNAILILAGPFDPKPSRADRFWRYLPRSLRELYMLFMGYPSDQKTLQEQLQAPHIQQKVKHLGKVPFEDLKTLLQYSEIFLMPNIRVKGDMEGFGLVCLEASISGTTVIASNIEGITDAIIDNKNGYLVRTEDRYAWRDAIERTLENDDQRMEKSSRFRQFTLDNYSWSKMTNQYASIFNQLSSKNNP